MSRLLCAVCVALSLALRCSGGVPVPVHPNPSVQRRAAALSSGADVEPQQLRLSLSLDASSMQISWVTGTSCAGSVVYWSMPNGAPQSATAVESTYTGGIFGWSGTVNNAAMQGLIPGSAYRYVVGCGASWNSSSPSWSSPFKFTAPSPASASSSVYVAVLADMGTIQPLGFAVADQLIEQHLISGPQPFDMTVLCGDLSYASIDPPTNEVRSSFGTLLERVCWAALWWRMPCIQLRDFSHAGAVELGHVWSPE